MPSFALLPYNDELFLWAEGPFSSFSRPPKKRPCLYFTKFDLSTPQPWKVPASWELVKKQDLLSFFRAKKLWGEAQLGKAFCDENSKETSWELFKSYFEKIQSKIDQGCLEKLVPVISKKGFFSKKVTFSEKQILFFADALGSQNFPYMFFENSLAVWGLSPELLFERDKQFLKTMALAGTCVPGKEAFLEKSSKDILEHACVVKSLREKLHSFTKTLSLSKTQVVCLKNLSHLKTLLKAELKDEVQDSELVAALHPTPALGFYPQTQEHRDFFFQGRESFGIPPYFGAPLGWTWEGKSRYFVMIRNWILENEELSLCSGAGIVKSSSLENEWSELLLKRASVQKDWGLEP